MEMVKNAVDEMIAGVNSEEYGINWAKPTANYSGEKFYSWELSESVVALDEDKAVADKIYSLSYDDLVAFVTDESLKIGDNVPLKYFSINSAVVTRSPLDEKTKRYSYGLRFSYYLAF